MKFISMLLFVLFLFGCQPSDVSAVEESLTTIELTELENTNPDSTSVVNQAPNKVLQVTGTLEYQDRLYTNSGFITSNLPMKPIRNVPVSLLANDVVVATTLSSGQGSFIFENISEGDYVLRVLAETEHASGTAIKIFDNSERQYAIEQLVSISKEQPNIIFQAMLSDRIAGIFNMLDVFDSALDFIASLSINNLNIEPINVYWQWGGTRSTYTCRATSTQCNHGKGIYVLSDPNNSGDSDEFDDDVLFHELAHHLELSMGMFDSPGGMHALSNYQLDLRLAWSEGMASAFAVSAKKWLRQNQPERLSIPNAIGRDYANYYIDTVRNSTLISVDLLSAASSYYRFTSNETAVSSALLRLQTFVGIEDTWQHLFNGLSANNTADTFEAFWDALIGFEQPSQRTLTTWQSTIAAKQIYFQKDEYETNDSMNSAQSLSFDEPQSHYLYRNHYSADEDWFSINLSEGQQVEIKTFDLINGADTQLTLNDQFRKSVATNDDAFDCETQASKCTPLHNGRNFTSKIVYTAAYSGIHYIQVKTTDLVFSDPVHYGYIGRYGGYSILLSELSNN